MAAYSSCIAAVQLGMSRGSCASFQFIAFSIISALTVFEKFCSYVLLLMVFHSSCKKNVPEITAFIS